MGRVAFDGKATVTVALHHEFDVGQFLPRYSDMIKKVVARIPSMLVKQSAAVPAAPIAAALPVAAPPIVAAPPPPPPPPPAPVVPVPLPEIWACRRVEIAEESVPCFVTDSSSLFAANARTTMFGFVCNVSSVNWLSLRPSL